MTMTSLITVTLTRNQVAAIIYDMGWEDTDLRSFWRLAKKEQADPGHIRRKNDACWERIMRSVERDREVNESVPA